MPRPAAHGLVIDATTAAVLVVASWDDAGPVWWVCTAGLVAGLMVHRRWPVPALVVASVSAAVHQLEVQGPERGLRPIDLIVPIVLFTLSTRASSRRFSAVACGVVLVGLYLAIVLDFTRREPRPATGAVTELAYWALVSPLRAALLPLLAVLVAFALADSVRSRRAHVRALEDRAADLEQAQWQRAALATAAERGRIARELHDVVAHSLAVMVAQAQAAVAAQERYPVRAADAMRDVVTVGRESLTEMRRVLGLLRPADPASPGLEAIAPLLDRVRATGLPVALRVDGPPTAVPPEVNLCAYRLIQEALTNTLKHAGTGARAEVHVAYQDGHVAIEIVDDGAGPATTNPSGVGLTGIAERVGLLGGSFTAGSSERGFAVRARLPLAVPAVR